MESDNFLKFRIQKGWNMRYYKYLYLTEGLRKKKKKMIKKLNENRGKIVTFDALCMAVWGDAYYGYENTLMVHIRHLRKKIEEDPSSPKWLLTARGLGYRLRKKEAMQDQC